MSSPAARLLAACDPARAEALQRLLEGAGFGDLLVEDPSGRDERRDVFDSDLVGSFVATPAGTILDCNAAFATALGFASAAAARAARVDDLFGGRAVWTQCLDALGPQSRIRRRNAALYGAHGRPVQVLLSAAGVFDPAGALVEVRGQIYDLTAHKALEEQLRQSQKIEAVGRLAGGIAHDFNNLLMVIGGHAEQLLAECPPGHQLRRHAEAVLNAADRAAGLTQQLLAFSRQQVLSPQVVGVNDLVRSVHRMLQRVIGEDIACLLSLDDGVHPIRIDRVGFEQVLMNLAINARDAMPDGGTLSVSTRNVTLDDAYCRRHLGAVPGDYVLVAVSDSGCGMDTKTLARIWEPFFTTKEPGKGTGLGLASVYGIVKQSGGYVTAYSEPGIGTTMKVYIPVATGAIEEHPAAEAVSEAPRGTETVLLVEDEEGVRELVHDILAAQGYTVFTAADGEEALRLADAEADRLELLITDVIMPRMSGRELARRLTGRLPRLRVLYLSGYTDEAIAQHGVLEPGVAFLQKPFTGVQLGRKIREIIGNAE